jgi:hypothetical protein|tara:strand:- start:1621 stop:2064 length:444 start_codon:yes stop_codon:yes gene_type:complete
MVDNKKKYPKRYIPKGLSEADKKKQKKQLDKSTADYKKGKITGRDDLKSFKGKKSSYVEEVKEKTGLPINVDKLADKFSRTEKRKKELKKGMNEVIAKGKGAYYSSGSRPNQTPDSWSKARLASVLVGGPSRKIDKKIVDKYNIPKI